MRRFWTPDEVEALRQLYRRVPAHEIAELLGRTKSQVQQAGSRYGFHKEACPWDARTIARLRRLHARGWSDTEIAKAIGSERHVVGERRAKLGLPSVLWSGHQRRRVAAKTREQLRKAGVPTLGALRVKVYRDRARAAGWPEDLRPRAVQILSVLWERGPQTRRQLADAIGMPWKGARHSLTSNDPEGSYLAHLARRGLVVRLGRHVKRPGAGRGSSTNLYSLPLGIRRNLA